LKKLKISALNVSVIIPTYNSAQTINRAIKSVQVQEKCLLEIILVDNGSIDETLAIVNSINDERLIILNEEKKGASFARNRGLKEAKGKYIQFLDADDELMPGKLKFQFEMCSENNLDLLVGSYKSIEPGGSEIITHIDKNTSNWLNLFQGRLGNTVSNLWRMEMLERIGGWNENASSSQEADLMFRFLKEKAHVGIDETISTVIFKDAHNRISDTNQLLNAVRFYELRLAMLDWIDINQENELKSNVESYSKSLFHALMSIRKYSRVESQKQFEMTKPNYWNGLSLRDRIKIITFFTLSI